MSKFATVAFEQKSTGATLTGEFVAESSNAWMVAVKGKVRTLLKDEWVSIAPDRRPAELFGGLFGGVV